MKKTIPMAARTDMVTEAPFFIAAPSKGTGEVEVGEEEETL